MKASIHRAVKRPFFGRYMRPWEWPAGVDRAGWTPIQIPSATGAVLAGLHGRAPGDERRGAVVLAHPMGSAAKGFFLKGCHAALLREAGYDVLLFDFNGFGESGMGGFAYPLDVIAAGMEMRRRSPGVPLAVMGVSFGAAWSLCALSRDDHPFQAAVLEAPFTTLEEFWRRYPVPYAVLRTMNRLRPGLAAQLRPMDRIGDVGRGESLLLVYGEHDDVTPPEMGHRLVDALRARAAPSPQPAWFPWPEASVEMWTVPAAGHTHALRTDPRGYADRVLSFLDGALRRAPSAVRLATERTT